MAMGCWLRGRSAWEENGVQGEGRGVECGRLGAKALRGTRGIRGHVRDQSRGTEGITRGRGERRGARGGGRCVDLAPGGLERRASLPYHPGLGDPRQQGGVIIKQGDHRPQRCRPVQAEGFQRDPMQRYLESPGQHHEGELR